MNVNLNIRDLAVLILLAVNSVRDVKKHEISLPSCAAGACVGALLAAAGRNDLPAGLALSAVPGRNDLPAGLALLAVPGRNDLPAGLVLSAVPGMISLLITFVTGGAIGAGDGIMLLTLGVFYPIDELAAILSVSCMLSAVYGGVLLVRRHSGKEKYAFVPFLLMGFAAVRFMEGGG